MARRKSKKKAKKLLGIIIAIILAFFAYESKDIITEKADVSEFANGDAVYVHFIDVGQGSSTLIQEGTSGILIDAGEKDYGQVVVDYLKEVGIDSLEYVVASHPHSDHIGGLDDVIYAFPVDTVIMPELEEFNTPTTRVYEDLLTAIYDNDIPAELIDGERSYIFGLGDNINVEVLGPVEQVEDLNDMSIILRANTYDTKFMILGDAEKQELASVYESPLNKTLSVNESSFYADVVALGHHGSSTSIYKPFLNAVDADVAVISCGKDNSYGHPHKEALDYIEKNAMTCLRTDESGDIVFMVTADGYSLVD
jgi:competence protein ComEC